MNENKLTGSLAQSQILRTLLVFSGIFTFLVDAYPLYAASALAANSVARSTFAAAFPLFGIQVRVLRLSLMRRARSVLSVGAHSC